MSLHEYAKECLAESLLELMEQKSFHSISITELTKKAGFSRMTFYRNYGTKEAILLEQLQEKTSQILAFFQTKQETRVSDFLILFFKTFRAEKRLILLLIQANLTHLLHESFQRNAEALIQMYQQHGWFKNEQVEPYKVHFIVGGLIEVLIKWAENDMQETNEGMAQIVSTYLSL
ncbi:transcriptional regulator, TetR family [Bacillus sp. JCM 19045]|nr:transcriptional regulator, TetR family [Bacillus sp. JCM 19045]